MTMDDLASHTLDWVEILGQSYRGHTVHGSRPTARYRRIDLA
jgi:hypothetical protein